MRKTNENVTREVKAKRGFRHYAMAVVCIFLVGGMATTAFATSAGTGDPLTVVNNLSTCIFGLIRAVGLSLQSHDPSQRSNGFLTLAGGIIITFAKEILNLITGGV